MFGSSGQEVGTEFRANAYMTGSQTNSGMTGLLGANAGGFVVTWNDSGQDGSGNGVYGRIYDQQGVAVGEVRINTETKASQADASVTALDDGGFFVTWESQNQDGDAKGIYGQRFDASGKALKFGSSLEVSRRPARQRKRYGCSATLKSVTAIR